MKKTLLIIAIAGLAFASCKKDRTCTCTVTNVSSTKNGAAQTVNAPWTKVTKITGVTTKGAACNSWSDQTDTHSQLNGNSTDVYVDVTKGDCKLS